MLHEVCGNSLDNIEMKMFLTINSIDVVMSNVIEKMPLRTIYSRSQCERCVKSSRDLEMENV